MRYEVLFNTQIEKIHRKKGEVIEFKEGTDTGFIKRLIRLGAIREEKEEREPSKARQKKIKKEIK